MGAGARYTVAWARASEHSGSPTRSTAWAPRPRQRQRLRIGVADVLAGEDHHPARDEARVLAGLEHARQPVERGVGVAAAHGLDEARRSTS